MSKYAPVDMESLGTFLSATVAKAAPQVRISECWMCQGFGRAEDGERCYNCGGRGRVASDSDYEI